MSNKLQDIDRTLEETTRALKEHVDESTKDSGQSDSGSTKAQKKVGTARGIETMFRSAYRVQMDLTALADNKANMMMSINGIIISIIFAAVAPKLDSNPWLLLPTTVFLIGNLVSIVYAILAARPRVSSVPITLQDLQNSKGNILFFGDFANLPEDQYVEGIFDLIEDRSVLYEAMVRNLYGLGSVLRKKFALLQVAYTVFMIALILGVASFMGVFAWFLHQAG